MSKASEYFTQAISEEDKHKAIELYTKAIELNPNFSEAYSNRGVLKKKSVDEVGAMMDFNMAIEKSPNLAGSFK